MARSRLVIYGWVCACGQFVPVEDVAGLAGDVSLCDLRPLRDDPAVELSSIRAQSAQMPTPVTDAFDAVLTIPTVTTEVDLTLG